MRADAAVDRGNTLASWAEIATPAEAAKLLETAVASYSEALRQEEDAVVRSKLSRKPSQLSAYHSLMLVHCGPRTPKTFSLSHLSQCMDMLLLPGAV